MRWLINYIRSCFCEHEWELLAQTNFYSNSTSELIDYTRWDYRCKKCGCQKTYKNK